MSKNITQTQLESYLWGAATLLRGYIDAGDYKQFIFPLLFYKRLCDVYDEEYQDALKESGGEKDYALLPEHHRFQVPQDSHWNVIRNKATNVGKAIQDAIRDIEKANPDRLYGIFGDAQWTNKDRLPDRMLKELIEHFSTLTLSVANLPEDELGVGYEFLIKKFADDAGHTAAEFYTNRTVVHLMTELLQPQPGESIYDPTCGSGGMLLSAVAHLKRQGKEYRNVKLYGQERNLMTSAIARMNLFLHGIEDFLVIRGDTLADPKFVEGDRLMKFDVVLANPPYSIKQWDRSGFESDPWGRNIYGTPPQARADYAFQQHINASLRPGTGRSVTLWPHGVLSRDDERGIRRKIVEKDLVEAVIGLGRNLFYNSGIESCLLICRKKKNSNRKGKILFIEAERYIHRERAQSFLSDEDIATIINAYRSKEQIQGLSAIVSVKDVLMNDGNLNIKLYVNSDSKPEGEPKDINNTIKDWIASSEQLRTSINGIQGIDLVPPRTPCGLKGIEFALRFNLSAWKKVRLGDIAEEPNVKVDNPAESEYDRYIGSDCIDRHDFRIKRWDPADSVKSAMKAFSKGDYLIVRRSLYGSDFRERAPRADFDGICSADIITIRERPGKIADGFLIGILYRKDLWDFIVSNSTGSLTRRIKWRQLRDFEFLLPPKDEQRRIAEILWAADDANEGWKIVKENLISFQNTILNNTFIVDSRKRDCGWKTVPLKNVAKIQTGIAKGKSYKCTKTKELPYLRVANVQDGYLDLSEIKTICVAEHEIDRYSLKYGDVLMTEGGDFDKLGRGTIWREEIPICLHQNHVFSVRTDTDVLIPEFLSYQTGSLYGRRYFLKCSKKTSNLASINSTQVKGFPVLLPSISEQQKLINILRPIQEYNSYVFDYLTVIENLKKAIIVELLIS